MSVFLILGGLVAGAVIGRQILPRRVTREDRLRFLGIQQLQKELTVAATMGEESVPIELGTALLLCGKDPDTSWFKNRPPEFRVPVVKHDPPLRVTIEDLAEPSGHDPFCAKVLTGDACDCGWTRERVTRGHERRKRDEGIEARAGGGSVARSFVRSGIDRRQPDPMGFDE